MTRAFIFDLDGTIYLGEKIIEGAVDALKALKERGDKVVFLTNKSIARRSDYVTKLSNFGVDVSLEDVVSSNYITARFLKSEINDGEFVYVIGEAPLFDEIQEQGIHITKDPLNATFVVVGWDREFHYDKLNDAYQAWRNGAKIIATNPDRTCPIEGGQIPDCAGMIGALEAVTGSPVDYIAGKPSEMMANFVVSDLLKMESENCYMIGDRLETDIKMGNNYGLNSVLVLSGITTETMLKDSKERPKHTLKSVKEITAI